MDQILQFQANLSSAGVSPLISQVRYKSCRPASLRLPKSISMNVCRSFRTTALPPIYSRRKELHNIQDDDDFEVEDSLRDHRDHSAIFAFVSPSARAQDNGPAQILLRYSQIASARIVVLRV